MIRSRPSLLLAIATASGLGAPVHARAQDTRAVPVTVDNSGVMHWSDTGEEVALFGVNYTAPFAYAFRAIGRLDVDRKAAIDADVTHFARLGLDAFRVHVWDREVSDRRGNLAANEHIDLLDYLLARRGAEVPDRGKQGRRGVRPCRAAARRAGR